jgi:hypothetical protein
MADGLTIGELLSTGKQRFLNIKLSTHALASAAVFLGTLWGSNPAFRAQVTEIFHSMPHWLQATLTAAAMVLAAYKESKKETTVTATVAPGETGTATVEAKAESK